MEMQARVDQLERSVRRLTAALGGVVLLAVVVVVSGAVKAVPERIEARKFIVVDEEGRTCAVLGKHDGLTGMAIRDGKQRIRMMVGVDPDGSSFINCCDAAGRDVLDLYVDRGGKTSIEIADGEGKTIWSAP